MKKEVAGQILTIVNNGYIAVVLSVNKLYCILLFLMLGGRLAAQPFNKSHMELSTVIGDVIAMNQFIQSAFVNFTLTPDDLINGNHSLYQYQFNKALNKQGIKYTLLDLPVDNMYAYVQANNKVGLYVLLDVNRDSITVLLRHLGTPENLSVEDVLTGDFDFISWKIKETDAFFFQDIFANDNTNTRTKSILLVTNMMFKEILIKEQRFK